MSSLVSASLLPRPLVAPLRVALSTLRSFWQGPPNLPPLLAVEWRFVVARWLGVAILVPGLLVAPLSFDRLLLAYAVVGTTAVYNLVVQRLLVRRPAVLAGGYVTTFGDAILNVALLSIGGGFDTPFYFTLFTIVIATAMRYGYGPSLLLTLFVVSADLIEDVLLAKPLSAPFVFRSLALGITVLLGGYLRGQVRQAEAALQERLRQASLLNEVTQDLGVSLDFEAELRAVVAATSRLFGVHCVVLRLPAVLSDEYRLPAIIHDLQPSCAARHEALASLCQRYHGAARTERLYDQAVVRETLSSGERATIILLKPPTHSTPLAALALAEPLGSSSPPLEPDLFASFVERMTLAIENAALYYLQARLNDTLSERESHLSAVLDNIAEGIVTIDEQGTIQSFNPAAERVFGYAATEAIGLPIDCLLPELPGQEPSVTNGHWLLSSAGSRAQPGPREATGQHKLGTTFPVEVAVGETRHEAQRLFIVSVHDITERKQAEAALEHQALHDQLTQLPNRTLLHDRLQQAISIVQRDQRPIALLILDLDRFKEVNDTFGHHVGDLLLQDAARRLQGVLRASDTIARLGGDEFAVVLPTADAAGAVHVATNLLQALDAPIEVEGQSLTVGASIGIALAPEHGLDAHTLLRRADVAMYVAKRAGDTYAIYSFDQDQNSPSRMALLGELRKAISQEQLVLHYQPKVALASGRVTSAEALVRWQHPQRGLVGPDQFVPLAEQTGLIRALTDWVLDAALRQCAAWQRAGCRLGVAVNFSMRILHDPQVPERIAALLQRWEVAPDGLEVEITESAIMADPERALDILSRLRDMGVDVAIDDFGTGYSSLGYLKRLPVNEIKIDKSFVRDMTTSDSDLAIVRSTIELGHNLGLAVVAEGVERQSTWELLTRLGCDFAQGYYLSSPLPGDRVVDWIRRSPGLLCEHAAPADLDPPAQQRSGLAPTQGG